MERQMKKIREVRLKKIVGKKSIKNKTYTYTYFTLPLNLYIQKHIVEKFGDTYMVEVDTETGVIKAYPKKLAEKRNKAS